MDPLDSASIFALRELLESLDGEGDPRLRTLGPVHAPRSVALLPGSFNPPTAAHVLLAERALRHEFDLVVYTLARQTVGKPMNGLRPEDRLLLLDAVRGTGTTVAACSHGLYADQAEAAVAAFPHADIGLLVGSDKVLQIFESRWYDDTDAALARLFANARLVVAPRQGQGELLRAALRERAHRRWSPRVEILPLHPAVSELSSTRVRGLLRAGADPTGLVPARVAELLAELRAFAPPAVVGSEEVDLYDLRSRLLDLLWESRNEIGAHIDLRACMDAIVADTVEGRRVRTMLSNGKATLGSLAILEPTRRGDPT